MGIHIAVLQDVSFIHFERRIDMRSKRILASLLIFTLIFVTLFSSSISFAAIPIGKLTLVRGDIQPTSLTIVVSWEKVHASAVEFKID